MFDLGVTIKISKHLIIIRLFANKSFAWLDLFALHSAYALGPARTSHLPPYNPDDPFGLINKRPVIEVINLVQSFVTSWLERDERMRKSKKFEREP